MGKDDTKVNLKTFDGTKASWTDWNFKFKAVAFNKGWIGIHNAARELHLEGEANASLHRSVDPVKDTEVYYALVYACDGTALDLLKQDSVQETGVRALLALLEKYELRFRIHGIGIFRSRTNR